MNSPGRSSGWTGLAVAGAPRDSQQLDPVAKLVGKCDVVGGDMADSLDMHAVEVDFRAESECGQNGEFVGRVDTVDVEGRVRLGIAQSLRVGENLVERPA